MNTPLHEEDGPREKIKMKWGQTPFDLMSESEVRETAKVMFAALESTYGVLNIQSYRSKDPYWQRGYGGKAFRRVRSIIEGIRGKYDEESIYRMYYRYACSLMFGDSDAEPWLICPVCKKMVQKLYSQQDYVGKICHDIMHSGNGACKGILREFTFEDFDSEEEQ